MRIQLSVSRRDEGAVAVMVSLLAVVLIAVAAFSTDFGMAYAQRQALSTGADSGVLAVVHAKYTTLMADPTLTCAKLAGTAGYDAASSAIALNEARANRPFNETILDTDVTTKLECVGTDSGTLKVTVDVHHTTPPILGRVIGASPTNVSQTAVAALGVANGVSGLAPIAMCTNQAQAIITQHLADVAASKPDSAQLVPLDKVWGSGATCDGGGGSGNWGWLNFGEGVSTPDLVDYITGTYTTTLTLDSTTSPASYKMDGTPGNKGNSVLVGDAMQTIMDTIITLPVYSSVTGSGANTAYRVIGFLSVKMCGFDNKEFGKCYDPASAVAMHGNDMQVRYAGYTESGDIGGVCAIGSSCSFNAYVPKLVG
jgi:Flp pilus assembly protein TadG